MSDSNRLETNALPAKRTAAPQPGATALTAGRAALAGSAPATRVDASARRRAPAGSPSPVAANTRPPQPGAAATQAGHALLAAAAARPGLAA